MEFSALQKQGKIFTVIKIDHGLAYPETSIYLPMFHQTNR